jgi:hypothetical protein
MPSPLESMEIVARRLEPLGLSYAFLGGAVIGLLVDNSSLTELRPTKDVDVIAGVVTYQEFSELENRLRLAGFQNDTSEGAPICRWIVQDCKVDIMPIESSALGMNSKWFREALELAEPCKLAEDCTVRVITPPCFIATKLEAFKDRGKGDYYGSHDLEDIITVLDGRADIVKDVSLTEPSIRKFISDSLRHMLSHTDFRQALPGHLPAFSRSNQRESIVTQRIEAISQLT